MPVVFDVVDGALDDGVLEEVDPEPVDVDAGEPLLADVSAEPAWAVDAVVPDVFVVPAVVDAPADAPEVVLVLLEVLPFEVVEELDGCALATPGVVTTITPIPKAVARAPTRPTNRP